MERKGNEAGVDEEFEPFCKWQRKEDRDVLEIHLPEFKKEQLKVQISNLGLLKISGERPLDASRKSKFYKELPVSSNYDTAAIHAKFIQGWLHITLPKRKLSSVSEANEKKPPETHKINDQTPKPDASKHQPEAAPTGGGAKEQVVAPRGGVPTESKFRVQKRAKTGLRLVKVAAVSLVATAALLAVLVACVYYMQRSLFGDTEV